MITFTREYHGFESAADIERDVSELFDNPGFAQIPGEFQGTIKVVITYTPEPDESLHGIS